MTFVKRRWPDLLIGLLVLLLLAGFGSLLLGNRSGTASSAAPPQTARAQPDIGGGTSQTATTQPAGTQSATTGSGTVPSDAGGAVTAAPATSTPSDTSPSTGRTAQTGVPQSGSAPAGTVQVIPATPITAAPTPNAPDAASSGTASAGADTGSTATSGAAPSVASGTTSSPVPPVSGTTAAPRSGGAVATSEARTPTRQDYRVSLGTFDSAAVARSRAAAVSGLGYTVHDIDIPSGVVSQIGPFANAQQAGAALSDIQRVYPGAVLLAPRGAPAQTTTGGAADSDTGRSAADQEPPARRTPARSEAAQTGSQSQDSQSSRAQDSQTTPQRAPASSSASSNTAASSSPAASTPAPSGPVYLQVAAYNSVDAAQAFVGRVRTLGFDPTVNAPGGQKVAVLVGPFQGAALTRAEARLDAAGLDHFQVR